MSVRTSTPGVAIVVTHYRSPDDLRANLQSIVEFGGPDVTEVWITDSEASVGLRELVREVMPQAHYLPFRRNVGYAALVNMGVAASSASYVMVMNADVRLTAGSVAGLAQELRDAPDVGVVFPQLRYGDNSLQHSAFAFHRPSTVVYRRTPLGRLPWGRRELERFMQAEALSAAVRSGTSIDVDWSLGAAMMFRREMFEQVGGLDEDYFLYFEDVDWCLRAWRAGWRCTLLPTATCIHTYSRASSHGGMLGLFVNPLTRRHIRSAVRFFRLYGRRVARPDGEDQRALEASRHLEDLGASAADTPEPQLLARAAR